MAKRQQPKFKRVLLWALLAFPALLAFFANVSATDAASNFASWFVLFGLPVPRFVSHALDKQITLAVLALYAGFGGMLALKANPKGTPKSSRE